MSLRITAISNEPLYPHRVVPRTLIDILEVMKDCNAQVTLLQPGSESNPRSKMIIFEL